MSKGMKWENQRTTPGNNNGINYFIAASGATVLVFVIGIFVIRICFVLRVSDFGIR
jgi:hypothetical protein